jgi:hypothetical protein
MTRKDFELIAATIKAQRDVTPNLCVDLLARDFADVLKATNKQFNRDKFLRACGVP